jgi:hypothetical protein
MIFVDYLDKVRNWNSRVYGLNKRKCDELNGNLLMQLLKYVVNTILK